MTVYRICAEKYKYDVLTGIGAEKFGGRWNTVGTKAVYCSENISLALLEYYINSDNPSTLPKNITVAKIVVPDDIPVEVPRPLPEGWDHYPYSDQPAAYFSNRAKSTNFFALKVPSSVVGLEHNYVLNPLYKDFSRIIVEEFITLPIDQRLKA